MFIRVHVCVCAKKFDGQTITLRLSRSGLKVPTHDCICAEKTQNRKKEVRAAKKQKKKKNCSDFMILIRWVFLVRSGIVLRGQCLQWETWTNITPTTTPMQNPTTFSHASAKLPNSQPSAQLRGRRELLNSSQHLAKKPLISFSAHNLTEEEENKAGGRGVCEGVAWGRKKRILFRKKCRGKKGSGANMADTRPLERTWE